MRLTFWGAVDDPHEGKRKCESNWDIHRIHWKKNRFIYEMYYKNKEISKELYDWMVRLKIGVLLRTHPRPATAALPPSLPMGRRSFHLTSSPRCAAL